MTKYLPTLAAVTAVFTFSANAQVTETTTEVIETTETTKSGKVRGATSVAPAATSTTVTEVAPAASATSTTIVPAAPATTTTVTQSAPAVSGTVVVERFDPVVAQRHLSVAPRAITITPEQRTALDRTVTIESRTEPVRRVYNVERRVVIVEEQGKSMEMPFVTVPVLFVVNTAELLDAESRAALEQTATLINGITQTDPDAVFAVEGHTSTEGSDEHNTKLSADRAARVFAELTERYKVPATALKAFGYGEKFATNPGGTEPELQEDRRVLVVRTR
jgi:outer membrane protein OmpA-like peptidoglycan-associated protein